MSDIDKVIGSYEHAIQSADWADTTEALAVVERARLELADLRRRAQGVDVEAVVREVRVAIDEWASQEYGDVRESLQSSDLQGWVEANIRRALARETGGV